MRGQGRCAGVSCTEGRLPGPEGAGLEARDTRRWGPWRHAYIIKGFQTVDLPR